MKVRVSFKIDFDWLISMSDLVDFYIRFHYVFVCVFSFLEIDLNVSVHPRSWSRSESVKVSNCFNWNRANFKHLIERKVADEEKTQVF